MKSLKLFLFTLICTFASPALPAFAIVESSHVSTSKVSTHKKVFPWEVFLGFRFRSISNTEAIVMGLICLVLVGICAWYAFPFALNFAMRIKQFFVALLGAIFLICALRYAVNLIVNNKRKQ